MRLWFVVARHDFKGVKMIYLIALRAHNLFYCIFTIHIVFYLTVMLSLVLLAPIQSISGGRGLSGSSSCKDNLNKPADWLTNPCSLTTSGHIVQVDTPVIPWTEVKNRIIHTQNWMTEQIASRNERVRFAHIVIVYRLFIEFIFTLVVLVTVLFCWRGGGVVGSDTRY